MTQVLILISGALAIWLTQQSNKEWRKYACLVGIVGQPFWLYAAYQADQWGILALSVFYTYAWCVGIKDNWITKRNR